MKTVVGLFDSFQDAHDAVRDLEACGFNHDNISIVAQKDVLGGHDGYATGAGAAIGAGLGILAGLTAVVVPGVGIVLALGPIIAGGLLGAVAGGLIGSLIDAGVPAEEAEFYHEGVRRGGTLVMISADDPDAPRAAELLCRHHPVD